MVCEIGPAKRAPPSDLPFEPTHAGVVEVLVEGDRRGRSQVVFTYRVGLSVILNLITVVLTLTLTSVMNDS